MRRYLGSKKKLLNKIEDFIEELSIKPKRFIDGFAGSGVVTDFFSKKYTTISNDYMHFSYIVNASTIHAKKTNATKIKFFFRELNEIVVSNNTEGDFLYNNFSPAGGRKYFSKENALLIDRARQKTEELYLSNEINEAEYFVLLHGILDATQMVSNITGTYSAYLKTWDSRSKKRIVFKDVVGRHKSKINSEAFNDDIYELLERTKKGDLIYLDPPYTTLDYAGAYHVLETISRYDSPLVYGVSGRRKQRKNSHFHKKTTVYNSFVKMISRIPEGADVILSYSSHGLLTFEQINKIIIESFPGAIITKKEIDYKTYGNINASNKEKLKEYLIHFKPTPPIKAPFNYQGSKEKISREIRKIIPLDVKRIVEPFAGGFNMGINTWIKNFHLNDISREIIELIKFLKKNPTSKTMKSVDAIINKYKMQKQNSNSFINLRADYNKDKKELKLLVLLLFTFNYQIRFNSKKEFNNPVGLGGYTMIKKQQLERYILNLKNKEITFSSLNFMELDFLPQDGLYYIDPPYLITTASYNDGKRGGTGWNANMEEVLLNKITMLHQSGGRFILSNVITHNNKTNHILKSWIEENNFQIKTILYKNRREIIVYNF